MKKESVLKWVLEFLISFIFGLIIGAFIFFVIVKVDEVNEVIEVNESFDEIPISSVDTLNDSELHSEAQQAAMDYELLQGKWVEVTDLEDKLELNVEDDKLTVSYNTYGERAVATVKSIVIEEYTNDLILNLDLTFTEGGDEVEELFVIKYINDGDTIFVNMGELSTIYRRITE